MRRPSRRSGGPYSNPPRQAGVGPVRGLVVPVAVGKSVQSRDLVNCQPLCYMLVTSSEPCVPNKASRAPAMAGAIRKEVV